MSASIVSSNFLAFHGMKDRTYHTELEELFQNEWDMFEICYFSIWRGLQIYVLLFSGVSWRDNFGFIHISGSQVRRWNKTGEILNFNVSKYNVATRYDCYCPATFGCFKKCNCTIEAVTSCFKNKNFHSNGRNFLKMVIYFLTFIGSIRHFISIWCFSRWPHH